MRHLLATSTIVALLVTSASAVGAQETSPDPGASPTLEERLATATCLGKPATMVAIAGVETVGTPGADVIVGTDGDDIIRGEGGNDRICAGDGADLVEGGDGKDRIDGGLGDDQLDGGAGNDAIVGGKGADTVTGAAGNDRLTGAAGDDTLDGGAGKDVCKGGPGHDWLPGCNDKRRTTGKLVIRKSTTLKGPHRGSIVIAANRVTLDCGGHTVRGRGTGTGILLPDTTTRVTVRNCEVTNFQDGISLSVAHRNVITGNFAHHNSESGIELHRSNRNRLTANVADDNGFGRHATWGIEVEGFSRGNVLRGNTASRNGENNFGLTNEPSRVTLMNNSTAGGGRGFAISGKGHRLSGNTVDNASIQGFESTANGSVFRDNLVTDSTTAFRIGGTRNTVSNNMAMDGAWFGFEDFSVPGVNKYSDNVCVGFGIAGSDPPGLCDDDPVVPDPTQEPTDAESPDEDA